MLHLPCITMSKTEFPYRRLKEIGLTVRVYMVKAQRLMETLSNFQSGNPRRIERILLEN